MNIHKPKQWRQWLACLLAAAVFSLSLGQSLVAGPPLSKAKPNQQTQTLKAEQTATININKAAAETLMKLPRVGPKTAERIIAFRQEHGRFNTKEELMNVKGIGPKTFERLKGLISL